MIIGPPDRRSDAEESFPAGEINLGADFPSSLVHNLRADPDTAVSIIHVRAERWTLSATGATVHRLERLETSTRIEERNGLSRRQRWLPAIAICLTASLALVGSFVAGRIQGELPDQTSRRSMTVVVPLFGEDTANHEKGVPKSDVLPRPAPKSTELAADARTAPSVQISPLTQNSALSLAFATDEPQQWSDGEASGWVVVGPSEQTPDGKCRHVAVLSRIPGAPDQTRNDLRCQSADGVIQSKP